MNYSKINLRNTYYLLFMSLLTLCFSCSKMDQEILEDEKLPSLDIGLEAHWELEGDATDTSPNGYDGVITGTTDAKDRFGDDQGALSFNGTTDYINLGNIKELGFGGVQNYTMAAWVKPEAGGGTIFSKWNFDVMAGWFMVIADNMTVSSYRHIHPWGTSTEDTVTPNSWQHILVEFDGENLSIYLNGVLSKSRKYNQHYNDQQTDILIGALHNNHEVTRYFSGVIDDVRVWSRTLTAEEKDFLVKH